MRRFAKLSLFFAPLLVSICGCATPSWMSQSKITDPREARVHRLMAVAAEYEVEGKQDAAMRVYEHVLAQQPDHADAAQRRDLLAQQGVKSGGRLLKPELAPAATRSSAEVYASHQSSTKTDDKTTRSNIAAEIHRKNAELAKMLAQQKTAKQPLVVMPGDKAAFDNELEPIPSKSETLVAQSESNLKNLLNAATAVEDPGWTSTGSSGGWTVVSSDQHMKTPIDQAQSVHAPSDTGWTAQTHSAASSTLASSTLSDEFVPAIETSVAEVKTEVKTAEMKTEIKADAATKTEVATAQNARPAEETSGWELAETKETKIELASASPTIPQEEDWQTTDLTRKLAASPARNADDDHWESTRLVGLCDNLSPELVPLVEKLENPDPLIRVEGLLELGELSTAARSSSIAVYSLLEDRDPIVAVYAAGTLRQVSGDAWSSVHTLMKYLEHKEPGISQLSAYLLGQMGPEAMDAVPTLERVRNQAVGLTSLHAAEALTHIAPADVSSVQALTTALSGADRELRWFAAVSLGTVAGECEQQAAEALKKALKDQESDVRIAACLSLGGLGDHAAIAIPDLEQAVRSDSPEVKSAAETALACLRG